MPAAEPPADSPRGAGSPWQQHLQGQEAAALAAVVQPCHRLGYGRREALVAGPAPDADGGALANRERRRRDSAEEAGLRRLWRLACPEPVLITVL